MCYDVWLKNQVTVLEAWGPRLAGGGIGYHGLSCHGKVYEDECRIASCEVSPCEAERRFFRRAARTDFFFLGFVYWFLVLRSRGARPPEGGATVMNDTHTLL